MEFLNFGNLYRSVVPRPFRRKLKRIVRYIQHLIGGDKIIPFNKYVRKDRADVIYEYAQHLFYVKPNFSFESAFNKPVENMTQGWIGKFQHASCFGGSDIILTKEGTYMYDLRDKYAFKRKTINCRDDVVLIEDDPFYYILKKLPVHQVIERGICLCGIFPENYYHFTYQILPKMAYISHINKSIPIILDKEVERIPNFMQLIDYCNTEKRDIIYIGKGERYLVEELYVLSTQMLSVPQYHEGVRKNEDDDWYCKEAIDYLRNILLPHSDIKFRVPKYVYLSRKNVYRRPFNDEECFNALKPLGFIKVFPEELTIAQQIALFQYAHIIVGGTGAAFTNLLYSSPLCTCIVLRGWHSENSVWSSIASYVGAKLFIVEDVHKGVLKDATKEHDGFQIETDYLIQLVQTIYQNDITK